MKKPFHPMVGIIGGGQLGKMLIESGMPWNIRYNVLDPDPTAPSATYAHTFIQGGLKDVNAIEQLAGISDIVTYEIEHIDNQRLMDIENTGKAVVPSPSILKIIQDKGLQKQFYADHNLPTARFKYVEHQKDWKESLSFFEGDKIVAKLCKDGYDGKGVWIGNKKDLLEGFIPFEAPSILEEFIPGSKEIAVLVASDGKETVSWPSIEMVFDPKLNLVDYVFSPGNLEADIEQKATEIAILAVNALKGKGVFAVEMFVTPQGNVLINEMAPRPHNSGHHTIEASITSQYEQLNRILLGLPLGDTTLLKPVVMVNIIGPEGVHGAYKIDGLEKAFKIPGFYLHWYNKNETRPGRKMGHFTVMADSLAMAIEHALQIKQGITLISD